MAAAPKLFVVASGKKWTSAGGVVLDRKGRVALVHERKGSGLRWALPKGKLEAGETLEEAALREVREEAGVRARILDYVGMREGRRSFVHFFLMDVKSVLRPHDPCVEEVRFVQPERAVELLSSARDRRILRVLGSDLRAKVQRCRSRPGSSPSRSSRAWGTARRSS